MLVRKNNFSSKYFCCFIQIFFFTNIFVVAGSEEAPEQDSLDGHLVASSSQGKAKRGRRQAGEATTNAT